MIDLLTAAPTVPAAGPAAAPASVAGVACATATSGVAAVAKGDSFGQTLGAFLDSSDAANDRALPVSHAAGQDPAADGKDLPNASTPDDDTAGPAEPWLVAFLPLPVAPLPTPDAATPIGAIGSGPLPRTILSALPTNGAAAAAIVTPPPTRTAPAPLLPEARAASAQSVIAFPNDTAIAPPVAAAAHAAPPTAEAVIADTVARAPTASPKTQTSPIRDATADEAPVALALAAQPTPTIAVSATPQPAGQVFAAAIAASTNWRGRGDRLAERSLEPTEVIAGAVPAALHDSMVVSATTDAHGGALDLTRDSGLQQMIDHIETLRDGVDAKDTRIRLIPDALGSVDVAVRQEGDRVHVRFTAEQDATRALIADAQPRLTEFAAARGVRIGETSVGTGSNGGRSGDTAPQPQQPRPATPIIPAPTIVAADTTEDQRLA